MIISVIRLEEMNRMDIFEKCERFTLADQYREMGIYPEEVRCEVCRVDIETS